jgi:oxalate decarboxylase family bicupin protein
VEIAHTPKSVLGENFHLPPKTFTSIPKSEKYIFQGSKPGSISAEKPKGFKPSKKKFTHKMLAQKPTIISSGGEVRIADSKTNFPISDRVAAAHLRLNPGAIREMHWHPNADEWSYFIRGRARVTVFAAEGNARTFDYMAGDVGIVPKNMGHFVENLSDDEPLEMLEIFRADQFLDFSLFQWLGETPQRMVVEHVFGDDERAARKFLAQIEGAEKDPIKGKVFEF